MLQSLALTLFTLLFSIPASSSPLNITSRDLQLPPADPTGLACDKCINREGDIRFLYANGKCNTLPNGEKYNGCNRPYRCGLCMLFKGEQCMGDMIPVDETGHWLWPDVREAQSHYCI